MLYLLRKLERRRRRGNQDARAALPAAGTARALALARHQFRYDLRSFSRNRQARFTTLVFPLLLLVVLVGVSGGNRTVLDHGVSVKLSTYYVPGLMALAIVSSSFASLVVALVSQRESGVLKRRRATPVPAWVLLAGQTLTAITVSLGVSALLLVIGTQGYDVSVPASAIPGLVLFTVLGSAAFCAFAYAVSTAIGSVSSAQPVVQLMLLPLYLISGVLVPASKLPRGFDAAARALPLEHIANGLRTAVEPHHGLGLHLSDLAVLALWTAVALAVALRRFSWLPRAAA
jgi:ABC-2 type transport system permease protein